MQALDQKIAAALGADDRRMFEELREPGFLRSALGIFAGREGWVPRAIYAAVVVMFLAGLWTGWHFLAATDVLDALHWGLPSAVLLVMAVVVKVALMPRIEAARLLRAIERLELLLLASR
ncbi:MAG: hypothetical protein JSR87_13475 [Proteobacteria bacterium]|nr:hypothetical protein [Pseudomonadota bacterium]MBS0572901.1 hypothetical protein [Pseudomonadota bacterium]